jgi:membrane protein required for colicin V production
MNALDAAFLVIVVVFVGRGFFRGFFRETLGLVGLVLAVLLSIRYLGDVTSFLSRLVAFDRAVVGVLAFVLVFGSVLVAARILAALLRGFFRLTRLGWLDRAGGAVVGLIKGAVLAGALAFIVALVPLPASRQKIRSESALLPTFRRVLPITFDVVRALWPGTKSFADELGESIGRKVGQIEVDSLARKYTPQKPAKRSNRE